MDENYLTVITNTANAANAISRLQTPSSFEPTMLYSILSLIHIVHSTALTLVLLDKHANQGAGQHALIVDPRMDLSKQFRPIATHGPEQLWLAPGVEGQVRREVVDAAAQSGPRILALASSLPLQHARRHAQVWRAGGQVPQVAGRTVGQARPVERRVAGRQDHFARRLGGLARVGWWRGEGAAAGLAVAGGCWV